MTSQPDEQPAPRRGLLVILRRPDAGSEDLAWQASVTVDYGRPFADRLVAEGMVARTGDALVLTDAGRNLIAKEPAPAEP